MSERVKETSKQMSEMIEDRGKIGTKSPKHNLALSNDYLFSLFILMILLAAAPQTS